AVVKDRDRLKVELADAQRTISTRDTTVSDLEAVVAAANGKIAELETQQKELEGELSRAQDKLSVFESETGDLEKALESTKAELAELRKAREAAEARVAQYRALTKKLASMVASGKLAVNIRSGKMVIQLGNNILFDVGKTKLKDEGREALVEVATVLKTIGDRQFLVAGHTDDEPVTRASKFASNWELSTARAVNVVTFLQQQGVDPKVLAAAGYGEFDPLVKNTSDKNRARNRRIEIILMPNLAELPSLPDSITAKGS
ncbi:MAG: OmpA family protein, partial [Myxococcota bacterium]